MLFRTVYGPELSAIYQFIVDATHPPSRKTIHGAFVPNVDGSSTQNADDALSFLVACGLIDQDKAGDFQATSSFEHLPFRILVLRRLRDIAEGVAVGQNKSDPLYWFILNELFILPDHIYIKDVHAEANRLRTVEKIGGLSHEKLQAWKRVMSYLGVGTRIAGGFQCTYDPQLILDILRCWHEGPGSLQEFLELHFLQFLPFFTQTDKLATTVQQSLQYLEASGQIMLAARQDSPSKPYFETRRIRYISLPEGAQ